MSSLSLLCQRSLWRTVAVLLSLGVTAGASAASVPINNPGFESDVLGVGGIGNTITGWDTSPGGGDGVYRPPSTDFPGGVPQGHNVAYANGPGNRVRQVLTITLAPYTRYVLEVEVGWNKHDPFAGYVVQLRAGGVILAEDDSSQHPQQGTFVTSTVEYTTGGSHPQLGTPLEIYLTAPGIQADFDDVRLSADFATVCAETHLLPLYLVDKNNASGTNTLFAVRNLTGGAVSAAIGYFQADGSGQLTEIATLGAYQVKTVSIRDIAGLAVDSDGFARGYVKITTPGSADGKPVLAGDFFRVDVGNNSATGDKLVDGDDVCGQASIRFIKFSANVPAHFDVWVTNPRGADTNLDPPSFTVQPYDEAGNALGSPQPIWTADHSVELASSDFTATNFGSLRLDFTNSLGGAIYGEYSSEGKYPVGLAAQCDDGHRCGPSGCCPPGAPQATVGGLHYPLADFPDCETAIADAVESLDSFHYRDACQVALGGPLPASVLGAQVVSCAVAPPLSPGSVVVAVKVCCPLN